MHPPPEISHITFDLVSAAFPSPDGHAVRGDRLHPETVLRKVLLAATTATATIAVPASALAAPPANDTPERPGAFETFFAPNGKPGETAALAELREATPDAGVPDCLGPGSFARTVW